MAKTPTSVGTQVALRGPIARIGHTGMVALASGDLRPFLVVEWNPTIREFGGWLYVNPFTDGEDPFLRARGLTPEARRRPCYCMVAADLITWRV